MTLTRGVGALLPVFFRHPAATPRADSELTRPIAQQDT
jgi:hypothetical protein